MKKTLLLFIALFMVKFGISQNTITVSGNFSNNGIPRTSELIQIFFYSLDSNSTTVIVDSVSTDAAGNYFLSETLPIIYSQGYVKAVTSDCNNGTQTKIESYNPQNKNLIINFNCLPVTCYNAFKYYVDSIFNNNYKVDFVSTKVYDSNDQYSWDFGDGNTAQGVSVSHNYTQSGKYMVCLTTVNTVNNCTNVYCDSVFVYNPINYCYASYNAVINPVDASIDFFAYFKSDSSATCNWDFGDGSSATGTIVNHKYANEGIYNVCLTVYDSINSCVSSFCNLVSTPAYQMDSCLAEFKLFIVPDSVNQGASTVYFSVLNYSFGTTSFWDFGDGNTAIGNTVMHTYANPGNYTITLIKYDSALLCVDTLSKQISINGGELKIISLGISKDQVKLNTVYPNPAFDKLNLTISSTEAQFATVRIVDLSGKLMFTDKVNLTQGMNLVELNTSNLINGMYILEVITKNSYSTSKLLIN
jgi:PKD repeat protein